MQRVLWLWMKTMDFIIISLLLCLLNCGATLPTTLLQYLNLWTGPTSKHIEQLVCISIWCDILFNFECKGFHEINKLNWLAFQSNNYFIYNLVFGHHKIYRRPSTITTNNTSSRLRKFNPEFWSKRIQTQRGRGE